MIERDDSQIHTVKLCRTSRHPFNPSIRDLGPVPLSIVCTPYWGANNTSSNKLDVGTFVPN